MLGARVIAVAVGYCFGLFQTGYIYGEKHGVDIRTQGSGNAGTTNTLRVLGWKAGLITFLGDLFKAIFAVLLIRFIFIGKYPDAVKILELYAGFGAVLGHNFPFYLKFKGGKGIACTSGMINLPDTVYWINRDYKICIVRFYPCCDKLSDPGTDIWPHGISSCGYGISAGILHCQCMFYSDGIMETQSQY